MKHFYGAFWSFTACGHQPLSLQCSCKLEPLTKLLLCCITEEKKPNGTWKLWQISFFRWPVPWNIRELNKIESVRLVVQQRSAATLWSLCGHRWWRSWQAEADLTLTSKQEGDETCFFGHVELESGATEHVLHHSLRAARSLQERQKLFRLLCLLCKNREEGRNRSQ